MSGVSAASVILVGLVEGQPDEVLLTAARLATDLGAGLVVAHVAPDPYLVGEIYDGTGSMPIVPALLEAEERDRRDPRLSAEILAQVERLLGPQHVAGWQTRALSGDPSLALGQLADELDARMIVVGTREHGVLASIAEFLGGSVAAHLAHRQHRPVLVVPLAAPPEGAKLPRRVPWEPEA